MTTTIKVTDGAGHVTTQTVNLVVNQTPPPAGTLFGMNFEPSPSGSNAIYEKSAKVARIYVNAAQTNVQKEPEFVRAYANGVRTFAFSWKDTSTTTLPALFDSIPKDCEWYGITHHEPEDDIEDGGYTLAQWVAWQKAALPIVRSHGGIPTVCFMGWTLQTASGRNIANYVLPAGLADVVLYDFYPGKITVQPTVVTAVRKSLTTLGIKRYGFGEYGVQLSDPTNGVKFIQNLKTLISDCEIACYWSNVVNKAGAVDWHFSDQTATAWFDK